MPLPILTDTPPLHTNPLPPLPPKHSKPVWYPHTSLGPPPLLFETPKHFFFNLEALFNTPSIRETQQVHREAFFEIQNPWLRVLHGTTYRMSQEECARLREGVPYVKIYRYNPTHLCPKLNGYGDIPPLLHTSSWLDA
jgi:hypothetical protein